MGKLGLQLYTIRDETTRDFLGSIKKVAQIGYQGVEFAGFFDTPADVVKKTLDEAGLETAGAVVNWRDLEGDLAASIAYCQAIACPTIICPWVDEGKRQSLADFKAVVDSFHHFGAQCKDNGIRFLHHIHGFEFIPIAGTCLMDYLLEHLDPALVNFEIDVYWVEHAGVDSVAFMEKIGSRCPSIHFKDTSSKTRFHDTEVGAGVIDMPSIMRLGKQFGAQWFIVEQEEFERPSLESAAISFANLKNLALSVE